MAAHRQVVYTRSKDRFPKKEAAFRDLMDGTAIASGILRKSAHTARLWRWVVYFRK